MTEVRQFYSGARGMCQQYLSAKVTVYVQILFVFCKNVCVVPAQVEPLNIFPSAVSVVSHRYPAESDRAKRVKFRLMLLGISFSTVS